MAAAHSQQGLADVLSAVNDLTAHLQLSFHGHVIPLPSSRTVGACLCALAIVRVLPSLVGILPVCRDLPWVYVVLGCCYVVLELAFYFVQRRRYVLWWGSMKYEIVSWYHHGI